LFAAERGNSTVSPFWFGQLVAMNDETLMFDFPHKAKRDEIKATKDLCVWWHLVNPEDGTLASHLDNV
jgi:hypothetical protein